jgi:four helix bundle protein
MRNSECGTGKTEATRNAHVLDDKIDASGTEQYNDCAPAARRLKATVHCADVFEKVRPGGAKKKRADCSSLAKNGPHTMPFEDRATPRESRKCLVREEPAPAAPRERDLAKRTKRFALDIMALIERLPCEMASHVLARQLLRCATSVGANYRGASGARSTPEFISKMGIVDEEADECCYWLDLLQESAALPIEAIEPMRREASELVAIAIASIRTARGRLNQSRTRSN